jgi:cell division protease FtsH
VWASPGALSGGGLGSLGGIGRSRARRYTPQTGRRVTFAGVASIDEVRMRSPRSSTFSPTPAATTPSARKSRTACCSLDRQAPGKTLLARATAGKADLPFSISASESSR